MTIRPFNLSDRQGKANEIPVILISLEDQISRRQILQERGIPITWVENYWPATDLRNTTDETLGRYVDLEAFKEFSGIRQQSSVIGCATSHMLASHWLARTNHHQMLVIEDDIMPGSINFEDQVRSTADLLMPMARNGKAFICHLGPKQDQFECSFRRPLYTKVDKPSRNQIWLHIDPRPTLWRAHAYLISRGAAIRSLKRESKIMTVADDWIRRRKLGLIENIFMVSPPIIEQDESVLSTIGENCSIRFPLNNKERRFLSQTKDSLGFRVRMQAARMQHMKPYSLPLNQVTNLYTK